jgi:AcrR family transcriptional regulator
MAGRARQKEESRARILASAGRGFRCRGYGGLGVDELAKQAGVTSGAFYAHFKSKTAAFREAVIAGLGELRAGIEIMRDAGPGWRERFVDFYLGERRICDLAESCALQSLTGEVARADEDVREAYGAALREVIETAAAGMASMTDVERRADAAALLALLAGGVSMARAVKDPVMSEEIVAAVRRAATLLEAGSSQTHTGLPTRRAARVHGAPMKQSPKASPKPKAPAGKPSIG